MEMKGNSIAHIYGYKEFDKSFTSTQFWPLNYITLGGAYHNFHHAFPRYQTFEFLNFGKNVSISYVLTIIH